MLEPMGLERTMCESNPPKKVKYTIHCNTETDTLFICSRCLTSIHP